MTRFGGCLNGTSPTRYRILGKTTPVITLDGSELRTQVVCLCAEINGLFLPVRHLPFRIYELYNASHDKMLNN